MKFFSADLETLRELYHNQLRMLLSAEQQITEALPKMIEKATDQTLKNGFETHLADTFENSRSLTIMFCVRSYEMPTVSAISLLFNLLSSMIMSHIL